MAEVLEIREASLGEIALVSLKLGTIAFGGPAAHLAMMEEEFVRRRQWITQADFLDRLAAANLIPGPSSTEVAIFVGQSETRLARTDCSGVLLHHTGGGHGFGDCVGLCALWLAAEGRRCALRDQAGGGRDRGPGAGEAGTNGRADDSAGGDCCVCGGAESIGSQSGAGAGICRVGIGGCVGDEEPPSLGAVGFPKVAGLQKVLGLPKVVAGAMAVAAVGAAFPVGLGRLFLSFLKIGSVVFGSGYVLLAFLQTEFVERLHWLTEKQLIDAVAVGQFTPGPVFTTATFIGYVVAGWTGAAVATVGIFLPGFVLVAVSGRLIPRLRRSAVAAAGLDGVVAGSLALMAMVTWQLGRASIVDRTTLAVFGVSLIALLRFRVNSAWVIAAAAVVGWVMR